MFAFLSGFYKMSRLMTINSVGLGPTGPNPNILAVNDGQQYDLTVSATAYTTYVAPA